MGKKVRVALFGEQRRNIKIDSDATEGAVVGRNLKWSDGTVVTEAELRSLGTTTTTVTSGVWKGVTLWSLITGVPAIIKSLATLATDGWIRNDSGVISASSWPYVRNSIDLGETLTIPAGHQLIVHGSWTNDGTVIADGELVIL